jgi:hypothetical protein
MWPNLCGVSVPGHHAKVEHPVEFLKEGEILPAWRGCRDHQDATPI